MLNTPILRKMADQRTTLLFPVETFSRELDFRLMLGMLMAQKGHRVLIGSENAFYRLMQLNLIKGSVYLGKLFSPYFSSKREVYDFYKSHGMRFIHLDEEGAVFPGDREAFDQQLSTRIDPLQLDARDYMFTWGERQKEFYAGLEPACKDNILVTGHPRFDLYKPEYTDFFAGKAEQYQERYGDFILMNSNLASVNSYKSGIAFLFSSTAGILERAEHYSEVTDRWRDCMEQIADFIELTFALSERYPERQIVIRPHPSEDHYIYQQAFIDRPNVHVLYEGAVGPWLVACSVMIHYNCTTAIEASLMHKPVINFRKHVEDRFVNYLPNSFGMRCQSEQEVYDVLETCWKSPETFEPCAVEERAARLLYNLEHDSMARYVALLEQIIQEHDTDKRSPTSAAISMVEQVRYTLSASKRHIKQRIAPKRSAPLFNQKFEGFCQTLLDEKIAAILRVLPTLTNVTSTMHSPFLVSMAKDV